MMKYKFLFLLLIINAHVIAQRWKKNFVFFPMEYEVRSIDSVGKYYVIEVIQNDYGVNSILSKKSKNNFTNVTIGQKYLLTLHLIYNSRKEYGVSPQYIWHKRKQIYYSGDALYKAEELKGLLYYQNINKLKEYSIWSGFQEKLEREMAKIWLYFYLPEKNDLPKELFGIFFQKCIVNAKHFVINQEKIISQAGITFLALTTDPTSHSYYGYPFPSCQLFFFQPDKNLFRECDILYEYNEHYFVKLNYYSENRFECGWVRKNNNYIELL